MFCLKPLRALGCPLEMPQIVAMGAFCQGARVEVRGLTNAVHLNGQRGLVVEDRGGNRWAVQCASRRQPPLDLGSTRMREKQWMNN